MNEQEKLAALKAKKSKMIVGKGDPKEIAEEELMIAIAEIKRGEHIKALANVESARRFIEQIDAPSKAEAPPTPKKDAEPDILNDIDFCIEQLDTRPEMLKEIEDVYDVAIKAVLNVLEAWSERLRKGFAVIKWHPYLAEIPATDFGGNYIIKTRTGRIIASVCFYNPEDAAHDHSPWQRAVAWIDLKELGNGRLEQAFAEEDE
jgi:hypothetical protein